MNRQLYISLLCLSSFTFAQTKVEITVDTNSVFVGDVIQLDINVQSDGEILWPDIETLLTPIEIQELTPIDSGRTSEMNTYRQNMLIQHFDTGEFVLSQIPFVSSEGDTFYTDSIINISFLPVVLDTTNAVFDIKEPREVPFNFSEAKPFVYGSLVFILVLLLVYYLIQKFSHKKPVLEEEIVELIPCNIEAIDALKNLESAGLCDRGEIKSHYVQLTDILRNYFDREYELDTVESTTHEIVSLLKSKKIDALLLKEINELLEEADLVKFAKSSPDGFTNDRFMKSSFTIVQDCHKMNEEVSDV